MGKTSQLQPLEWHASMNPSFHHMFGDRSESLDLILTSSPLVRIKKSEPKLKLFKNSQVIDISKTGILGHNLKRAVKVLGSQQMAIKSGFHSVQTSTFEYLLKENVGFHQCKLECKLHTATVMDGFDHLIHIFDIFDSIKITRIPKVWVLSNQTEQKVGNYQANYSVSIQTGDQLFAEILPHNNVTKNGKVDCIRFYEGDFEATDCEKLGLKTSYWHPSGQYYSQSYYKLNVQVVLSKSFELNKQANQTNVTSEFDWQLSNANFRILTPVSRDIKEIELQKAACFCFRDKTFSLKQKRKAISILAEIAMQTKEVNIGIERQRIVQESSQDLSSVPVLLEDLPNIKQRPPVEYFLNQSMIYPLSINSSDSAWIIAQSQNNTFDNFMDRLGHNKPKVGFSSPVFSRQKRNPVVWGTLKFFSLGSPYILGKSTEVLQTLAENFHAKYIVPDFSNENKMRSEQFAAFLKKNFNDDIHFTVSNDRITAEVPSDFSTNHKEGYIDEQILQQFSESAQQLAFFQKALVEKLPQLLLTRLAPEIKASIRPKGKVMFEVIESKSFLIVNFYWEQTLKNSKLTKYHFWSLPSSRIEEKYFTHSIENLTVSIDQRLSLSARTNNVYSCQKRALTNVPLTLDSYCELQECVVQAAEQGLQWRTADLFLLKGPATMHYGCLQDTKVIKLNFEFNLVLMDRKCSAHSQHESGLTFNRPAINQKGVTKENLGLLYLAGYNVAETVSDEKQTQVWLSIQGALLGTLFGLGLLAIGSFCYFKRKLGVRIYQSRETPNRTHIDFVDKDDNHELHNLFYKANSSRSSSFNSQEHQGHLPSKGGVKGEQLLQKTVEKAQNKESSCLVPQCHTCTEPLGRAEGLNTQCAYCPEVVFPHMRAMSPRRVVSPDSGMSTSEYSGYHKVNGKPRLPQPPRNYI